jgi:hypothetical protein
MARDKLSLQEQIDNSDPSNYLNGRIKDNTGAGGGTPVNERVYGDIHQFFAKLMNLAGLGFTGLPENEINGYQYIESLRNLATKNDLSYNLSKDGSVLTLPIRLSTVADNEIIRAKATFDKGSETSIKGTLDNSDNKTVTYLGNFKQDEYVRIINLPATVLIIREVDAFNLGTVIDELFYLKAATQAQENAGTLNTVATTPLRNKTTFTKRVIGDDSDDYLADTTRNGLLSSEFWDIIDGIGTPALRNRGRFVLGDIGGISVGTIFVSFGQIKQAKCISAPSGATVVEITFDNEMDNANFRLDLSVESLGNFDFDNDYLPIPFKKVSTNQGISTSKAKIYVEETTDPIQNIQIHVDVIQL